MRGTLLAGGHGRILAMPEYEFQCAKCGKQFTVEESIKEHGQAHTIKCPKCSSTKVDQRFSSVLVQTSKKS
jgi:putative FmdB family regulatory protein